MTTLPVIGVDKWYELRKLYGGAMLNEIIDSEVNEATKKALQDGELRIAMAPNVELDSDMTQVAAGTEKTGSAAEAEAGHHRSAPSQRARP